MTSHHAGHVDHLEAELSDLGVAPVEALPNEIEHHRVSILLRKDLDVRPL
jgi:hypothetical protein